jgi:hypothetical protein
MLPFIAVPATLADIPSTMKQEESIMMTLKMACTYDTEFDVGGNKQPHK